MRLRIPASNTLHLLRDQRLRHDDRRDRMRPFEMHSYRIEVENVSFRLRRQSGM